MHVCDIRVQRELKDKRKQDKTAPNKATLDTMIANMVKMKGKNAYKWKIDKLCAFMKHLKQLGNQRVPALQVDLLVRFEMTRYRNPVFGNVPMVDASDMKMPGSL